MGSKNKVSNLRHRMEIAEAENRGLRALVNGWSCPVHGAIMIVDKMKGDQTGWACPECAKHGKKVELLPSAILDLRREEAMGGIVAGALRNVCIKLHSQHCVRADCIADQFNAKPSADCVKEVDALIKIELDATARTIVAKGQPK